MTGTCACKLPRRGGLRKDVAVEAGKRDGRGKIWVYFCRLPLDYKLRRNNWRVRNLDSQERKKEKDDRLQGREMVGSD